MCTQFADYGTHIPILAAAVSQTEGEVLELGMGNYSTPMLHYMTSIAHRQLVSAEANKEWFDKFAKYAGYNHITIYDTDWNRIVNTALGMCAFYSVVFVDFAPGEMRAPIIDRLRESAQFIVVHDTETDYNTGANYGYEPVFKRFKHRHDFRRFRPYTTVVSQTTPFYIEECDREWKAPE